MGQNQKPTPKLDLRSAASQLATERIDQLLGSRDQIATKLRLAGESGVGETSRRLVRLGDWFQRDVTADQVLRHPDALVVCCSLLARNELESKPDIGRAADMYIDDSIRATYSELRIQQGSRHSLLPRLAYPFALLLFSFVMLVFASFYLVLDFEQMFSEFGLTLPVITEAMLGLAGSVRRWWIAGAVSLVFFGILLFSFAQSDRRRIPWPRRLRIQSLGLRTAWVKWAWHTGWLLKAGLGQADAIAVAGSCSSESWLRRNSSRWADGLKRGTDPFSNSPRGNWQPYGLLAYAFELENNDDQAGLLHAYALIHRDNTQLRRLWWLSWVTPAIMLIVGMMIGLFVIALYAPMIQLIAGLT
jgi:type II secretory pathway component PulF